jgi:formate hydrogenlyase subunit 3/multisubunit Na+/H+ antiporter MnhD subunit
MIYSGLPENISSILLFMVAGIPLLMTIACSTPLGKTVDRFLPLAPVPALIAALTVPLDLVVEVPWFFMGGLMGLDNTGRIFLGVTAFIWLLAAQSGRNRHLFDPKAHRFNGFFLAAMTGNFGLILAQGMLGFYLFFALMSFAAYGFIVHESSDRSLKAGRIYLILVMVGEIAMFIAILLIADSSKSLAIRDIGGGTIGTLALVLLFIGFGVKVGALPLHSWMPLAYQSASPSAASALAGAMINAGIIGWLRFLPLGQVSHQAGARLFIVLGALASIYGVISGLTRKKAGTILACSSISQMGLLTVIFGLGLTSYEAGHLAPFILILCAVHHAFAKSSLFLGYGASRQSPRKPSNWQLAGLLFPSLALAGFPLTSGAIAKTSFKDLIITIGNPWYSLGVFFLPISALGTTLLMLHFIHIVSQAEFSDKTEINNFNISWLISLIAVALPIWLWPAAGAYVLHSFEPSMLWQTSWPVGLGCLIYLTWVIVTKKRRRLSHIDSAQDIKRDYLGSFYNGITGWFTKDWLPPPRLPQPTFSPALSMQLRNVEKKLGRWTIVGIFYLALCFLMFFVAL